jgi:hypothetical protein
MTTTTVEGTEPWKSAAQQLLDETNAEVVVWRSNIGGRCYPTLDAIEVPRPKSAVSFAVFAHEIAHLRHQTTTKPRYQEEVEAWEFALAQFNRFGLRLPRRVREQARRSIRYAFAKAVRRGANPDVISRAHPRWTR